MLARMSDTTSDSTGQSGDTTWASLAHLSALVGFLGNGVGFILGPLIVWLIKKDKDPLVDHHGKEALNFQITMFGITIICAALMLVLIGFVLLPLALLTNVILTIIAGVKVSRGEDYRYPFAIRLIK